MDLVRDLLDTALFDRNHRAIGCVDGIVLEVRADAPPRVAAMEIGIATVVRRLTPRFAPRVIAAVRRLSPVPVRPVRLGLDLFKDIGVDVELQVDAASDPRLLRLEKWLRRHIVHRLPGGGE
jgi:hypothetical protein